MITRILAATILLVGIGVAQDPGPIPGHMGPGPVIRSFGEHQAGHHEWWKNPTMAQKLGLTDAQVQKLNQIAYDHRLKMTDLRAALEREEVKMQPLMESATPDENQILSQIDKISAQRAQVEKANVQMMLATRRVLTPEQSKKLQEGMRSMMHRGPDGPGEDRNVMYFRRQFRDRHDDRDGEPTAPSGPPQQQ